jgi:TonB family protein
MRTTLLAALALTTGCAVHSAHDSFPTRVSAATLPAADRLATQIATDKGDVATQVRLCVTPTGTVDKVAVLQSSGLPSYDAAVVAGVSKWRYTAYQGPSDARICERATINYRTE